MAVALRFLVYLDLLRLARQRNPDAYLVFKPHPDVETGLRKGKIDDALIEMTEVIRRIDRRTEKMERRLEAQEQWTAGQKTLISRIGYVIGIAFLSALGGALGGAQLAGMVPGLGMGAGAGLGALAGLLG